MESRKLSTLLSSLVSQLLLLLLILFSPNPISIPDDNPDSDSDSTLLGNAFPLVIHHFLSSQEIAAAISLFSVSRKRKKRKRFSDQGEDDEEHFNGGGGGGILFRLGPYRSPDSFKNWFKMTSATFEWLAGSLEPLLDCRDPVGSPLNLSADIRLAIGLFRLATGSDYPQIAAHFGVSESAARFCSKQLCRVLCTDFRFWVNLLNPGELHSVSVGFEDLFGLPNCCGVIGCTRFRIARDFIVGGAEREDGSVAAQILVDSSSRILSIVAGFRGEKSDSKVLKLSTLFKDIGDKRLLNSPPVFVNGVAVEQYLIGNGSYPLLPWLMVPFADALPGSSEDCFNRAVNGMRIAAIKTVVSLKNWGVLSKPIEEEVKTGVAYIGACSILHNALLMREDYSALADELGSYSLYDQSSQFDKDSKLVDDSVERKASVIRSALAAKAKEFDNSKFQSDPSGLVRLQST